MNSRSTQDEIESRRRGYVPRRLQRPPEEEILETGEPIEDELTQMPPVQEPPLEEQPLEEQPAASGPKIPAVRGKFNGSPPSPVGPNGVSEPSSGGGGQMVLSTAK